MDLQETFYRKVVDPLLCPPPVITHEGNDAHAKNEFVKYLNRPECTTPLIASVSSLALSIGTGVPPTIALTFFLTNTVMIGVMNVWSVGMEKRDEQIIVDKEQDANNEEPIYKSPEYYIDRTEKQKGAVSPEVASDLLLRQHSARSYLAQTFMVSAALTVLNPALILPSSVLAVKGFANYWQNKRTIEGDWCVHETLPKKEPKRAKTGIRLPQVMPA